MGSSSKFLRFVFSSEFVWCFLINCFRVFFFWPGSIIFCDCVISLYFRLNASDEEKNRDIGTPVWGCRRILGNLSDALISSQYNKAILKLCFWFFCLSFCLYSLGVVFDFFVWMVFPWTGVRGIAYFYPIHIVSFFKQGVLGFKTVLC